MCGIVSEPLVKVSTVAVTSILRVSAGGASGRVKNGLKAFFDGETCGGKLR